MIFVIFFNQNSQRCVEYCCRCCCCYILVIRNKNLGCIVSQYTTRRWKRMPLITINKIVLDERWGKKIWNYQINSHNKRMIACRVVRAEFLGCPHSSNCLITSCFMGFLSVKLQSSKFHIIREHHCYKRGGMPMQQFTRETSAFSTKIHLSALSFYFNGRFCLFSWSICWYLVNGKNENLSCHRRQPLV